MSDTENFVLVIKSKYFVEKLHLPIIRKSEKACLVRTQGGELCQYLF